MFESNQVMLDPSILVAERTDKRISQRGWGTSPQFEVYIPESFYNLVRDSDSYRDDPTFSYFLGNLSSENISRFSELESLVVESETYTPFSPEDVDEFRLNIDYDAIQATFNKEYPKSREGELANVLFEEFVFLFEQSWIPSRLKKPLNDIIDIDEGVRNIDFDRDAVDELTTAAKEETLQKLRRLKQQSRWRWIALGGEAGALLNYDNDLVRAMLGIGLAHEALCLRFDP